MKFNSIDELLKYTEKIKGKTFKEIDSQKLLENTKNLKKNKGILGHIVESGFYKYPINSNPQADFDEIGVELKVTGYKKSKKGLLSAKERVSLSKIDYNTIVYEDYEFSKLISKNKKILFIWYLYEKGKDIGDFLITDYQLYDMSQDEEIIRNDFNIIKEKVKHGRAHELSEGDTSYLGACTKAATSNDRTSQPYSHVLAKPRAFSLKNAYMTGILRSMKTSANDIKTNDYKTVEEYINKKIIPYIGKTQLEILEEVSGKTYKEKIPKNISKIITDSIIGKDSELPSISDLFAKTSFIIKNLPLTPKGKPRERMSFRTLSLSEFEEDWEDSDWKTYFEETTLLTILWREPNRNARNGYRELVGVKRISFDEKDLESFKISYDMIKETIDKRDTSLLPTPNSFEGQILVVAPKGKKVYVSCHPHYLLLRGKEDRYGGNDYSWICDVCKISYSKYIYSFHC
uniref:Sau3AI family type II restriction endonuclease n=1 Tax=uncultured Methanobrevibacter sp. TaxID=253161 RepID=UPI002601CC52